MKFKSKNERLQALAEAWQLVYGRTQFTATEVAEWGRKQGLYPVPRRAHPPEQHRKWEERLAKVLERARKERDEASRSKAGPMAGPDVTGVRIPRAQSKTPIKAKAGSGPGPGTTGPDGGGGDGDQAEC